MDSTNESLGVDSDPVRHELPLSRDVASEFPPQCWHDTRKLKVLGMGTALPGRPVATAQLLKRIEDRFGVAVSRRGAALASWLKIATRHVCRDFRNASRGSAPRKLEPRSRRDRVADSVRRSAAGCGRVSSAKP
jgi:hypothetical protein